MFSYLYKEPLAIYRQAGQSPLVSTNNGSCLPACIDRINENMCLAVDQHANAKQVQGAAGSFPEKYSYPYRYNSRSIWHRHPSKGKKETVKFTHKRMDSLIKCSALPGVAKTRAKTLRPGSISPGSVAPGAALPTVLVISRFRRNGLQVQVLVPVLYCTSTARGYSCLNMQYTVQYS